MNKTMPFKIYDEYLVKYPTVITDDQSNATAQEALDLLVEGNLAFSKGEKRLVNTTPARVQDFEFTQKPWCIIHSCVDSREPVTTIFQRGVSDIFNACTAGNNVSGLGIYGSSVNNSTYDNSIIGSIEFAMVGGIATLPKLFVVMAHTNCGAVAASYNHYQQSGTVDPPGGGGNQLGYIVTGIKEAALKALTANPPEDIDTAAKYNVDTTLTRLRDQSTVIADYMVDSERLVYGALYNTGTGLVEFAKYNPVTGTCAWA